MSCGAQRQHVRNEQIGGATESELFLAQYEVALLTYGALSIFCDEVLSRVKAHTVIEANVPDHLKIAVMDLKKTAAFSLAKQIERAIQCEAGRNEA